MLPELLQSPARVAGPRQADVQGVERRLFKRGGSLYDRDGAGRRGDGAARLRMVDPRHRYFPRRSSPRRAKPSILVEMIEPVPPAKQSRYVMHGRNGEIAAAQGPHRPGAAPHASASRLLNLMDKRLSVRHRLRRHLPAQRADLFRKGRPGGGRHPPDAASSSRRLSAARPCRIHGRQRTWPAPVAPATFQVP